MLGRKKNKDPKAKQDGFLSEVFEVKELIVAYAKQETIEPIKSLGRFLKFGVPGALLLAVGSLLLTLAALRALQTETGTMFQGNWSWAPYFIVFFGALAVGGFTVTRIGAKK